MFHHAAPRVRPAPVWTRNWRIASSIANLTLINQVAPKFRDRVMHQMLLDRELNYLWLAGECQVAEDKKDVGEMSPDVSMQVLESLHVANAPKNPQIRQFEENVDRCTDIQVREYMAPVVGSLGQDGRRLRETDAEP